MENKIREANKLSTLTYRYLCGEKSLKELRHVNRVNLLIAERYPQLASKEALLLLSSINKYELAVKTNSRSEPISLEKIEKSHSHLLSKKTKTRYSKVWIGEKSNPIFMAPHPDKVGPLLIKLIKKYNHDIIEPEEKAKIFYMQLLSIHPFEDGNGRLSRAIFEAIKPSEIFPINPILYRLKCEKSLYRSCHENYRQTKFSEINNYNHEFWDLSKKWVVKLSNKINNEKEETEKKILEIKYILSKSRLESRLFNLVNAKILISFDDLFTESNFTYVEFINSLSGLLKRKLIFTLKINEDNTLVVSPNLLKLYRKIDELILS